MANNAESQTSLKGLFQSLIPDPFGIFQGKVISSSPLKIQAINDEKLIINALLLIVPKHLTNYTVKVDISDSDGSITSGTMEVHNALAVGEKVHLFSLNNGKKYYILDRVV